MYTQISKDKLQFNIKFNLDWITNLIKDGIIEKYIFTKGEIEIGIHYFNLDIYLGFILDLKLTLGDIISSK
ncbi:hypothetical protein [Clostridium beijerinckii]|uniref:Uncharacterized protein n=1 Tax=Clostridium beijerinckii TaxID=1520 RepID=A0AB74VAK6_CLOBE|nr:hypothetical protein [Clostridium beijerinckii]QUN33468.1 hypothetical protein KEC93_15990 [Clostridium beijerinckii]